MDFGVLENLTVGPYWLNTHGQGTSQTYVGGALVADEVTTNSDQQIGIMATFLPYSRHADGFLVIGSAALSLGKVRFQEIGNLWNGSYSGYVLGLQAGYQWIWGFGLNVQLAGGVWVWGPTQATVKSGAGAARTIDLPGRFLGNWTPTFSINLGYAI